MAALYSGVGMSGYARTLQRDESNLDAGNRSREIAGNKRICVLALVKSNSLPSRDQR